LLTGFRDRNNVVTQSFYSDPFNRPTQVKSALGISGVESRTLMYYAPGSTPFGIPLANNDVLTAKDQTVNTDSNLRSWTVTDGFGRTKESWTRDPQGDVKVATTYDALSRTTQVSNPFRPSVGETAAYTQTTYDLLGRFTSVTTPDGAVVSTAYSANTVTVTDQALKKRKSVTDALGRLKEIYEDPTGLNYLTSYQYDTLDNLTTVTQGTQTRTFGYNSLKQLLSATNPESGTVSYQYDDAGNLLVKTDARGVSAHFAYDAFSRVTRRWYNGSSSTSATTHNSPALPSGVGVSDEAGFLYDVQSLPTGAPSFGRGASNGRLVAVTYGTNSSNGDYSGYDSAGRNVLKIQQTGSVNYQMSTTLNLSGAPTALVYPSGHTMTYGYDVAARTSSVVGNLGDGTSRNYATDFSYSALGGLVKEKFGTANLVYHKLHYNLRGQLYDVRASNVNDDLSGELGALVNFYSGNGVYGGSGADNNGNVVKSQTIVNSFSVEDRYSYDALNRLASVAEYQNGSTKTGLQQYDYDRWGNRTISPATWGTGINNKQFAVNAANNRLSVPAGQSGAMSYDAAGNLTNDTYTGAGSRTYDAENKITSAWGGNNQAQLYGYDAGGQRIKRTVDGVETWQVYGFGGELLAEYPANGAAASPQKEYGYRNGQLLITADAVPVTLTNVALPANGGTVTASSTMVNPPLTYPVSSVNNGDRKGVNAGSGGSWLSSSATVPQWVQVDFNGSKSVSEIDVFSLQDNYGSPIEPTETTTFSLYGLTAFDVQYWNGSTWATVPGGSVSGNNKVWKKVSFAPLSTSKIRVLINGSVDGWSRMVEVEAWAAVPSANVALSASGATASASSTAVNPPFSYPVSAINNGDRKGLNAGTGGNWLSSTATFPQWVQVDFNGSKTIGEIDVFSLQDNYGSPIEPTETTTFSLYGLTAFDLQYWNGSSWTTVPGGSVTGNNKVWKKVTFTPLTTSKIRVLINGSVDGYSRVVELEAWTPGASNVNWLVTDHLGTPRMIIDQTGNLANIKRHDYLPFGEELFAPAGGRSAAQGYTTGDGMREQFTSKERDRETDLDYFGYRYYAPIQGRWTSVDPTIDFQRSLGEPQAWNLYQYCINNPSTRTDPDGRQDSVRLNGTHAIEQELRKNGYSEEQIKIIMEEYRKSQTRAAKITIATLAGIALAPTFQGAAQGLLIWAASNPDRVEQLGQMCLEGAGGPPALIPAPNSRLRPTEVDSLSRLAKQLNSALIESAHEGEEVIVANGPNINKTIDVMGHGSFYKLSQFSMKEFKDSILGHVQSAADYTAIDLKGASKQQIIEIRAYVDTLKKSLRDKVIYISP